MEPSSLGKVGVCGSEEDDIFSRKSKFLDVQSLYKSRALKEGNYIKKGGRKHTAKGNKEFREGEKRSITSSSGPEGLEGKKSRRISDNQKSVNGVVRHRSVDLNDKVVPSLTQSQSSINASGGVSSLSLDNNSNFFRIPKRPRGPARQKRFESDSGSKEPVKQSASVYSIAGVNDEVKKVEIHRVSTFSDSSVASANGQATGKLQSPASNVAKQNTKRKASNTEHKESENGIISAQHYKDELGPYVVHDDETSCMMSLPNCRKKKVVSSGNQAMAEKVEKPVRESFGLCRQSLDDVDDEENLEQNAARMLSSRFDPSCTGFSAKMRSSVSHDSNGFSYIIPSSLELADRDMNSLAGSESPSVENPSRVLRPRKQYSGKRLSRKRRHYYEIVPRGLDAHWVLNRRIKVFWPLDRSWYYGLISNYDPKRKVHHIKYDDRDEEWVDLQSEKFKLLLLPDEVPGKAKQKQCVGEAVAEPKQSVGVAVADNGRQPANNLDSEPIIASRSSRQVNQSPSSPLEKQKLFGPLTLKSNDNCNNRKGNGHLLDRHGNVESGTVTLCSTLGDDCLWAKSSEYSEGRKLIVYYRKRYRKNGGNLSSVSETEHISESFPRTPKFHAKESSSLQTWKDNQQRVLGCSYRDQPLWLLDDDGFLQLSMRLLESAGYRFDICLSLLALHPKFYGIEQIRLSNILMLSQYGTIVSRWPVVALEMLIVDNITGMRSLLFEGSLDHVSAFVFLILSVFKQLGDDRMLVEPQLPVTSIMIRLSCVINPRKEQLFAFYNFSKLKCSKWLGLDPDLEHRSLLSQQLPLCGCTYGNVKAFEGGNYHRDAPCSGLEQLDFCQSLSLSREDMEINSVSNAGSCSLRAASAGCLTTVLPHSEKDPMHATNVWVTTLSTQGLPKPKKDITRSSLSKKIQKNATEAAIVPKDCDLDNKHVQFVATSQPSIMKTSISHGGFSAVGGMSVEIPSFDTVDRSPDQRTCSLGQPLDWNANMGYANSPNNTGPRSSLLCNRSGISPHRDLSPVWPDGKINMDYDVFSNGPKKPRTQVQYTMPYGGNDSSSKHKLHQRSLPYKRIRKADERRNSIGSRSSKRNLEFSACDANVLVTSGDKGWRDYGARVSLELADHNEWRLAIRITGVTKYSCKVNNILQWSTNRYTHAMMWKGGKDWALEFPYRSQWLFFKEMHEECHNRNIRAASVKHIPIPGVRLIEDIDDCANSMPFIRHSAKYFKQVENDVEMAMNPLRVLYDMDSDDELWLSENKRAVCSNIENHGEISDELFEKTMDMFEKISHAENRDRFTVDEIDELAVGVGSTRVVKHIYEHWLQKRQRKGISMIRHLQPPLWEQYHQQVKEWEQAVARGNTAISSVCQERPVLKEKPPMIAFCLRPRGLEILNKGSKHRSHKKLSVSVHNHELDAGRRLNGVAFGEDRVLFSGNGLDSSEAYPLLQASTGGYSPRDASVFGCFSLDNDGSEWNHPPMSHSNRTRKFVGGLPNTPSVASHNQKTTGKRNGIHQWTVDLAEWPSHKYYQPEVDFRHNSQQFDGSDVQEYRLRNASGAARHAQNMAKIKRERAHRLMYRADMAIHKAVVAIMTAEAMKVAIENFNCDS